MINTYQTSMALPQVPPPVPPRLGRSHPVLIPAQLPSPGHSKPLLRFLVAVVVLHLLLSVGGFLYLFYTERQLSHATYSSPEGRVGFPPIEKQETAYRALARLVIKQRSYSNKAKTSGYLQWDTDHSVYRDINYYEYKWVTIVQPGDYFVYSRVTFSRGNSTIPLTSFVKMRKSNSGKEEVVMKAYCSMSNDMGSKLNPHMCTVTQQDVITLERGNQLGVWVEDLSLVDYEIGATGFGMYKV
ncbi:CD40 ligand [Girardinichthys multiradiatus]|uniref:CD40 ligand n=1 Tax=Girardinichthys multiradiatus TaxID=208333 RepID=UPI001FAE3089|nr:CD40 ligand [Girardinichthys multiradiatus]